jgi:solute carrier family 45 protein 1/2/4
MTHAGNIVGFGFGFLPLSKIPLFQLLGGTQFRKFCILCIVILVLTVWITCALHEEKERENKSNSRGKSQEIWNNIKVAIVNLPRPIRRVCYVQFFAFMGWFPFLFYSTTYVGQIMALELDREPDADYATRTGEFAMLLYSIVAVIAGTILPHWQTAIAGSWPTKTMLMRMLSLLGLRIQCASGRLKPQGKANHFDSL